MSEFQSIDTHGGSAAIYQQGAHASVSMDGGELTIIRSSAVADILNAKPSKVAFMAWVIGFSLTAGVSAMILLGQMLSKLIGVLP